MRETGQAATPTVPAKPVCDAEVRCACDAQEHAPRGNVISRDTSTATRGWVGALARELAKAPIHAYRWTLRPWLGAHCRHLPTCSEYGLEAIERNGAWRGLWLTASRIIRCRPGGTSGYDPVPDITRSRHALAPWRYGRWR